MTRRTAGAILLPLALCAVLAAGSPAAAGEEGLDPVTLANLERAARAAGGLDIGWRQPKFAVPGGGATELPTATPASRGISPQAIAAAVDYSRAADGLGLIVWRDGAIVAEDYSGGAGPALASATYSMHKSVLAMAILCAIEDGILESLDTPVGRYLEEWADDARGEITFRQLLRHASGLKTYSFAQRHPMAISLVYSDRIRETALAAELEHGPGTRFDYNNFNSEIAGLALEAALARRGLDYAAYLSRRLWQPIGAGDATIWGERPGGTARYFSGLEAAPRDWLRLGVLILDDGVWQGRRILSSRSVQALAQPGPQNPNYGLHLWLGTPWQRHRSYGPSTPLTSLHSAPYRADDVMFFDGFGGQRVYIVPSARLVIVRTGNASLNWDDAPVVNRILDGMTGGGAGTGKREMTAAEAERLYRQRLDALLAAQTGAVGLPEYDPLETVPGREPPSVLARWPEDALPIAAGTVEEMRDWAETSGASALLIWHEGRLLSESYFGDTAAGSLINSRSLAKPLSVIAIGRAIAEGYIRSLDQPVADFITEWRDTDRGQITLSQLLQMRSGLAAQSFSPDPDDIMNRAYLHPFHADIIIEEYPLVTAPGSRYDYSNANSELIAPVIERATGMRYGDWLSATVLKPLGAPGGKVWVNRPGGTAHAGCCILLPAETWLRLSVLLLQDGIWEGRRLLPEGFVESMRRPTAQNPHAGMGVYVAGDYVRYRGHANPDTDYGKSLHSEPYLARDLFLFDGNGHQVSYIIPSHDLVILRTGTNPPKTFQWDNAWLPNTLLRALSRTTGRALDPQPSSGTD